MRMFYDVPKLDSLVKVAKRENNTKRSYLYVNPLQGKHVPASPGDSYSLFCFLAEKIQQLYANEKLMVIGFAETATAIGTTIAYKNENVKYYVSTTREEVDGAEYMFFTESHSHATEQRLVVNDLDVCIKDIDRIVFAEDEVTTGNTIEKLINLVKQRYPESAIKFTIASLLNSMTEERLAEVHRRDIDCIFIRKIPFEYRISEINKYTYLEANHSVVQAENTQLKIDEIGDYWNQRVISDTKDLRNAINSFVETIRNKIDWTESNSEILVLGTEEFMFPGMLLAQHLENLYKDSVVRFHASSRSPIEVSLDEEYPLHKRYALESFYEAGRSIFIYDLKKYDKVIILTDTAKINNAGVGSLIGALTSLGNQDIYLFNWRKN